MSADAESKFDPRIPLVIGAVGHRDFRFEARGQIQAEVGAIFDEFLRRFKNTPLVLLTPLAVGADRLVASVALKKGIGLIVPLPSPLEQCRHLLPSEDAEGQEILRLLAAADKIEIPESPAERDLPKEQVPDHRWEHCGAFVARHCQVLIALWDGEDHETGTRRVIRWHKDGYPQTAYAAEIGPLDRAERGPVYHVVTPRQGESNPREVRRSVGYPERQLDPTQASHAQTSMEEYFDRIWSNLDRFNSQVIRVSGRKLTENEDRPRRGDGPLARYFVHADAVTAARAKCARNTICWLFVIALFAFGFVETYAHLSHKAWQLGSYILLMAIAGLVYWRSARRHDQQEAIDYRALAEGLRVAHYWRVAKLDDNVADHYLRQFRSELDWIRQAVRNCVLISRARNPVLREKLSDVSFQTILDEWVRGQIKFLREARAKSERRHHRLEKARIRLFAASPFVACIALGVHLHGGSADDTHGWMVTVFALAVGAAMATEWDEKNAYGVDARRYQSAWAVFETARQKLSDLTDRPEEVKSIVRELGREALAENSDWVIQHRHRPLGMPNL